MWQGPWLPITASSSSICWLARHSMVWITPHSPGHACHQSPLKLLCTILQRVGGGGNPLGAERQMGSVENRVSHRAGSLLASNAEDGPAGCREGGAQEASRASQLQQPSTEQLECSLGVAEASPSCLGFFHQVWCI